MIKVNLKKILTCAVAVSIFAATPCVSFAATDYGTNYTKDRTAERFAQRPLHNNGTSYQKARFVKLTMDDKYNYYLDRESVQWIRLPYSSSEYIADVWIRMIERNPEKNLDDESNYEYVVPERDIGEVIIAREKNIVYAPIDLEVLKNKHYFMEHYYIRPKTKQIQFLCELEVVGHPQNNVDGREYSYMNWENLVPGSIESEIYKTVLNVIGTSMADPDRHRTFADYFEEYTRISIR